MTENLFIEDILSLVTEEPRLVSDIIQSLRGGRRGAAYDVPSGRRWRNVSDWKVEEIMRDFGCFLRYRQHGAGNAHYVATVPFSEVSGRNGNKLAVQAL